MLKQRMAEEKWKFESLFLYFNYLTKTKMVPDSQSNR